MRVLVLSDMVRPNGAGLMALLGAEVLADAGHQVTVLGGAMDAALEAELAISYPGSAAFTNDERALDGSVTATAHVAFVRTVHRWLHERLDEVSPDLLYVHNCGRILSQLDLADLSRRLPVVHTMHDEWLYSDAHYTFRSDPSRPVIRTFEPSRSEAVLEHRYDHLFDLPGRVDAFTAVGPSAWITDRARRVFPTLDIVHLPNAVDASFFTLQDRSAARARLGLPQDRAIALFVGSPTQERKGFSAYERACRRVETPDGAPLIRLVVGGSDSLSTGAAANVLDDGPLRDRLRAPASAPGVVDIEGAGLVVAGLERSLMPAVYGAADVLVHPSVVDNLPTVPIEGGLCGTRTLASDVGGTRETIADEADLFAQCEPPRELAKRITDALADAAAETPEIRQERRSRQVDRFSVEGHRTGLLALFDRIVSGRGR